MKSLLTASLVVASLLGAIAAANAGSTSTHYYPGQPDWAQEAFTGATDR